MAITRKGLKAMGLGEEQIEQVIDAHTEVVDRLKDELKTAKAGADELEAVTKERDALKAAADGGFEEKYKALKAEYEKYKGEVDAKEMKAAKEAAARAYFETKSITGKNLDIAMRGAREEIGALELSAGKIKDTKALDELIAGDYAGLVVSTSKKGANTATPPRGAGRAKMTREEILSIKDASARKKAIAENMDVFGYGNEQKG